MHDREFYVRNKEVVSCNCGFIKRDNVLKISNVEHIHNSFQVFSVHRFRMSQVPNTSFVGFSLTNTAKNKYIGTSLVGFTKWQDS